MLQGFIFSQHTFLPYGYSAYSNPVARLKNNKVAWNDLLEAMLLMMISVQHIK